MFPFRFPCAAEPRDAIEIQPSPTLNAARDGQTWPAEWPEAVERKRKRQAAALEEAGRIALLRAKIAALEAGIGLRAIEDGGKA